MFRGGYGGLSAADGMTDEQFEAYMSGPVMIPVNAGPRGIRNTGDVAVITQWIEENASTISDDDLTALLGRIESMNKIDELSRKASTEVAQGRPGKPLPRIAQAGNGFILPDIKLSDYQHSSNGCWACAYQLLLQSRGVELTQFEIKSFRPKLTEEEAFRIESGNPDTMDTVRSMNQDEMSNPFESPDLALRTVPNCAIHSVSVTSYRDLRDEAAYITPDAYLDNTVDFVKAKISEAILDQHSPVALLVGNHYVTVVGIDGNDLLFKDSNGAERTLDPDITYRRNIREYLSPITYLGYGKGIELNWLSDIHLAKDGRTIYGLPAEGVYLSESGAPAYDPNAKIDGVQEVDFRCQNTFGVIPRMHELATEGIAARERAYLPDLLNREFLLSEAKIRTDSDEAALRATDREHGVAPAKPVVQPQPVTTPQKPVTGKTEFTDEFLRIFNSYQESSKAFREVSSETIEADPAAALALRHKSIVENGRFAYARDRILLSVQPDELDKALQRALPRDKYEEFDRYRQKAIDQIVKNQSGSITKEQARSATARYIPQISFYLFDSEETTGRVVEELYSVIGDDARESILGDIRAHKSLFESDGRYEHLIESEASRLLGAIPDAPADGKAAKAREAITRADSTIVGLSDDYVQMLMFERVQHDKYTDAYLRAKAGKTADTFEDGRYKDLLRENGVLRSYVEAARSDDVDALMKVKTSLSEGFSDSMSRMMKQMEVMYAPKPGEVFAAEEGTKQYGFRKLFKAENDLMDAIKDLDEKRSRGEVLSDQDYDRIIDLENRFSAERDVMLAMADEVKRNFSSEPFTEAGNVDITRTPGALAEFAEEKSVQARINGIYSCFSYCASNGISIDDFMKDPVNTLITTSKDELERTRPVNLVDPAKSLGSNLAQIVNHNDPASQRNMLAKRGLISYGSCRALDGIIAGEPDSATRETINLLATDHNDLISMRITQIGDEEQLYSYSSNWLKGQKELFMELAVRDTKDISFSRIEGADYGTDGVKHDVPQSLDEYLTNQRTIDYAGLLRRFDSTLADFKADVRFQDPTEEQDAYVQSIKDKMVLGAQEGFIRALELRREKDNTKDDYREMEKAVHSMAEKYAADLSPNAIKTLKARSASYSKQTAPLERYENTMVREGRLHITDADAKLLRNVKDNLDYRTIPGLSKYKKDIEGLDFSALETVNFLPIDRMISTASGEQLKLFTDSVQKMLEPTVRKYHDVAEKILADKELMQKQPDLCAYLKVIREYTDNSLSDRPDALDSWNSPIRKLQIDAASYGLNIPYVEKGALPSMSDDPKFTFFERASELFEMEKAGNAANDPDTGLSWSEQLSRKARDLDSIMMLMNAGLSDGISSYDLQKARGCIDRTAANYATGHTPDAIYLRTVIFDTAEDASREVKRLCPGKDDLSRLSPEARQVIKDMNDLENWYRGPFPDGLDAAQTQERGRLMCNDVRKLLDDMAAYREASKKAPMSRAEKDVFDTIERSIQHSDLAGLVRRVDDQYNLEKRAGRIELSEKLAPFYEMMKDTKEGWLGHGNSTEYKDMMSSLEKVITLSKRAEDAVKNPGVNPPLSAGERKVLENGLRELDKACEAYLKGKEKERSTQTGKDRYAGALGVLNLIDPAKADKYIKAANEIRKTRISFKQLTDTAEEKREERKKRDRTKQAAAMKDKKQTKQQEQVKPEGRN